MDDLSADGVEVGFQLSSKSPSCKKYAIDLC